MEWFQIAEFLGHKDKNEASVLKMVCHFRKYSLQPYGLHKKFDFENKTNSPLPDEDMKSWPVDLVWKHTY